MSDHREIEEREIDDAYDRGFEDGIAEAIRRIRQCAPIAEHCWQSELRERQIEVSAILSGRSPYKIKVFP